MYRRALGEAVIRVSLGYEFVRAREDLSFRELIGSVDASEELRAQAPGLLSGARTNIHAVRLRLQTLF